MRRTSAAVAVLACLLALPAAAGADTMAKPSLAVKVSDCETGVAESDRSATFTGSMPAVAGATSMAMHFVLYERLAGHRWHRVAAPNLGGWEHSDPNVAGFVFDKHVEALAAPASYRVTVTYRWYSAGGDVVRSTQRTSRLCAQPDLRPDLSVSRIDVASGADADHARYVVTVRNTGRTGVRSPFGVALAVDGIAQPAQSLASLDAGATATVTFTGPPCAAGAQLRAAIDPDDRIDESDEADDATVQTC